MGLCFQKDLAVYLTKKIMTSYGIFIINFDT